MADIVMIDSTKDDFFICGHCKTIFTSLELFLDHKRNSCAIPVSDEKTICMSSNFTKSSSNVLSNTNIQITTYNDKEDKNSASNSKLTCKLCAKTFKTTKSFSTHLKTHNGRPYQCLICGKCFGQNSHLKRHEVTHKVWQSVLSATTAKSIETDTSSYTCMYCNTILASYGQFRIHLKLHNSLKKFKCIQKDCNNLFQTIDLLLQHVAAVHSDEKYFCPICEKEFNNLEDSAVHQQGHEVTPKEPVNKKTKVEKMFKCLHCDAVFKNNDKLKLHMTMENHAKTCVHCNKTFASHKRLRLHLQIHKKAKPFECSICSECFSLKKYLSAHMAKHSDKMFICLHCNYKFKRKDNLQRHMKSHQKKKMYKCPFRDTLKCMMEFTRSDKLNLHIKSHTKQMSVSPKKTKKSKESNSSTIEIMIVPLDSEENSE